MDYSPPYIALLSFTTCLLMPYACLFACSNALACEMGDIDRRVRLAWQEGQMVGPSITPIPRERLPYSFNIVS